jgi:hypothetical protein
MVLLFLMMCFFSEGFLLRFLTALVRESRHSAAHRESRSHPTPTGKLKVIFASDEEPLNLAVRIKFLS